MMAGASRHVDTLANLVDLLSDKKKTSDTIGKLKAATDAHYAAAAAHKKAKEDFVKHQQETLAGHQTYLAKLDSDAKGELATAQREANRVLDEARTQAANIRLEADQLLASTQKNAEDTARALAKREKAVEAKQAALDAREAELRQREQAAAAAEQRIKAKADRFAELAAQ